MTNLRQAAEMALEALEEAETQNDSIEKWDRHALAIEVLRQALSQDHGFDRTASHMAGEYVDTAQQEPVARVNSDGFIVETGFGILEGTLLYTAPPKREWVGLTDEEIADVLGCLVDKVYLADFRALEAKLKEKNSDLGGLTK